MSEEKVTVITVVYNLIKSGRVKYFKQMLRSVRNRTYKNIEHIVMDGKSTDGTLSLLDKYQKKGYIKYYSEKDNGPYDAMNKGIKKADSDYVIILHSDDYLYDKNVITLQMKYLKLTNSDYTTGDTVFIDKDNNVVTPYLGIAHRYDDKYFFLKGDNTPVFWMETSFNHEGMLFKKSVFERIGYFSDEKIYGTSADFKFEVDLVLKDIKHTHIPYNFLCFRTGGASSTEDKRFYKILEYIYSKFYYLDVNKNLAEYDKLRQNPTPLFVYSLKNYLTSLNLKNFDYKKCFDFLDLMLEKQNQWKNSNVWKEVKVKSSQITAKLFSILPLLKIKDKNNIKYYKLFDFLPLLKVKTNVNGTKEYKLFNFLPIMKIKKK